MCVGQANVGKTSLIEYLSRKSLRPLSNLVSQSDLVVFANNFGGGVNDIKSLGLRKSFLSCIPLTIEANDPPKYK